MHRFNIDFMGKRKHAIILSSTLVILSLLVIFTRGLSLGIDFTGGVVIELEYEKAPDMEQIRHTIEQSDLGEAVVQNFGSARDVLIRLAPSASRSNAQISTRVLELLPGATMRRVEFVGPQVGDELTEDGGLAVLWALIGILIYVALRFQSKFAPGAVIALIHDVTIVLGVFAALQMEFDLPTLAAILAVIGYSLNDTIVVYDRIRENFPRLRKAGPIEVINISLNQTLSRTLMTSFTTLLVLIALFFLGGDMIHDFAAALLIGIVVGTYSSIYVASTSLVSLGVSRQDLIPVQKEGVDVDHQP